MGGEKGEFHFYGQRIGGSPPHGRGKVTLQPPRTGAFRITPAWAGKSMTADIKNDVERDHPRMGGEKTKKIP